MSESLGVGATHVRIEEAARILGVSRTQMFRLLKNGEIASYRVGRHRLVPRAACAEFIEKNTVPATR